MQTSASRRAYLDRIAELLVSRKVTLRGSRRPHEVEASSEIEDWASGLAEGWFQNAALFGRIKTDHPFDDEFRLEFLDGYRDQVSRMVTASYRGARQHLIVPFPELAKPNKERVLRELFFDFAAVGYLLADQQADRRAWGKTSFRLNPVLYVGPLEIKRLRKAFPDVRHSQFQQLILHAPANSEATLSNFKQQSTALAAEFRQIPPGVLKDIVFANRKDPRAAALKFVDRFEKVQEAYPEVTPFILRKIAARSTKDPVAAVGAFLDGCNELRNEFPDLNAGLVARICTTHPQTPVSSARKILELADSMEKGNPDFSKSELLFICVVQADPVLAVRNVRRQIESVARKHPEFPSKTTKIIAMRNREPAVEVVGRIIEDVERLSKIYKNVDERLILEAVVEHKNPAPVLRELHESQGEPPIVRGTWRQPQFSASVNNYDSPVPASSPVPPAAFSFGI